MDYKIACWNIRSMNKLKKQKEVVKLIKEEGLSVCAIIETHLKPGRINEVSKRCFGNWNWVSNSVYSINSCRILVGWDDDKRRMLWDETIAAKNIANGKPWCLLGDFNVTMKPEEHTSGGSVINEDMQEFIDCINEVEVEDIHSSGMFFTWIKSPSKPTSSIMKKLDRIMVNQSFMNEFKSVVGVFRPFMTSDHSHAILRIAKGSTMKKKSFRFPNFIVEKEDFLPIVKQGWNEEIEDRVEECRDKLKKAQLLMEKNPFDEQVKKEEATCLSLYLEAVSDEENLLMQKAKLDWISKGDRNTKFFHKMIKSRANSNKITSVCNEKGEKFKGNDVAEQFKISDEDANKMIRDINEEEIKEAMFDIGDNKAPGPDGNGKLLGEVNATIISLILKIHHPNKVSDFRPIACFNVLYKCISKILTNRIKSSLDVIVNPNQSAFIPGRIIQDNLMLSQELLKGYNCKSGPSRCALKIDIAKAYDTVNWIFLEKILKCFGFHEKMVAWIMTCVSSASFTIGINGERYGFFKSGRGLRQGDPISPYLFTLVMEVFSLLLARNVTTSHVFKYHKGCKDLKLTHLSFADDLLVFCHGDVKSIKVIKEALLEFSKSSGLIPNMDKSVIFFGNVKEDIKRDILQALPFKMGKLPVKYLGIPLMAKRLGIKECKCLVDKVKCKVLDWKNKCLSYAGRLQLIASVLSTMQAYWAAVVKIPKAIVNDIDRVLKKFLWSNSELSKERSKVAWKIVYKPKCEGGLGLSLWVKWVNVVKLKGKSFWEVNDGTDDSCTWRTLLDMRLKVRPFFVYSIGNGRDINMWSDNWCTIGHMRQFITNRMITDARINDNCALADMMENGAWLWPEEWIQQMPMLGNIPVPRLNEDVKDCVKWKRGNGKLMEFNVKNAWWDLRDKMEVVKWWKVVWFPQCYPRNAFILWMAILGKLYTQDRIQKWNNGILLCPLLNMENVPNDWKDIIEKIAELPCIMPLEVCSKMPSDKLLQVIMENIRLQIQKLHVKKTIHVSRIATEWNVKFSNEVIDCFKSPEVAKQIHVNCKFSKQLFKGQNGLDAENARVATKKKDASIKAREESKRPKVENRAKKEASCHWILFSAKIPHYEHIHYKPLLMLCLEIGYLLSEATIKQALLTTFGAAIRMVSEVAFPTMLALFFSKNFIRVNKVLWLILLDSRGQLSSKFGRELGEEPISSIDEPLDRYDSHAISILSI
ncbi:RNA-directed DNA polymerase, eukaryota, reverse transcriptase zinc-binding domain protein [Tanacetum coccineum]|uniref:RNA-directed DNA polymerase, eukaryota, reverse transcriptase zinc-binding domain protein n=1 Tax=Tanacetum coccineum TaxID=301880 RepID=A0ABQ5BWC7_9ASTR